MLMKERIFKNGMYVIFGLQTFVFGLFLIFNSNVFSAKGGYSILAETLNEKFVALVLLVVGLGNILIALLDKIKLKRLGLVSMQFVWLVFFFAFLIKQLSGETTSGWVLILGLVCAMGYEAWGGDFD